MGLLCANSYSQRQCGAMDHLHDEIENNPERAKILDEIEAHTAKWIKEKGENSARNIITIPVVVHVVYRTGTENISDAQIQSQIDVLNDDFRRLNSDADGTWSQAADVEIEFCLASVDPDGNPTSGITRTSTTVNGFGTNDAVKFASSGGKDAWPSGDYLNFWVCNIGGGILGYAQFPGGNAATDGVVNGYQYTGTIGTATAPFNLGRTATHEVGHWLNLRHIWGDGGCGVDDFVSDTPTSDAPNYGCAAGHQSCGTTDMVQNYMDYSDDGCMNLFTQGQKSRMQALFAPGGARVSLTNSEGCGSGNPPPPGCDDNEIVIIINFDNYPEETAWSLTNSSGDIVGSGGTYATQADGSTLVLTECVPNGCYDFTLTDTYGDGICCSYGSGSYSVTSGGTVLASGGSFGSFETTNICVGGGSDPEPTCNDGEQNGDETGVDCGGPDCEACPTCDDGEQNGDETGVDCGGPDCDACPTCDDGVQNGDETGIDCGGPDCDPCSTGGSEELLAHYFESGWDGWQDGGSDCYRYSGSRSYEGSYSIRLRDNSGTKSAMTSATYDVSSYSSLEIEFYFYPNSMENGEDFFVRYYDGNSWNTVATYASGTSFNNNSFYSATVTVSAGEENEDGFSAYPNPVSSEMTLVSEDIINVLKVYSITGTLLIDRKVNNTSTTIDVSGLGSGIYMISIETEEEVMTKKFIKR